MKRKIILFFIACFSCCIFGCAKEESFSSSTKQLVAQEKETDSENLQETKNQSQTEMEQTEKIERFHDSDFSNVGDGYVSFATKLLQETYQPGRNQMISPASLLAALVMEENGAKEATLSQMQQVLWDGVSVEEQADWLSSYLKSLTNTKDAKLNLANSIWIRDNDNHFLVEDAFLQKNVEQFDAQIFLTAFDEATLKDMNVWVSQKTDGMISQILDNIGENDMMYLVNAVAFDAQWQTPYRTSQVQQGIFTKEDKTQQQVELMYSTEGSFLQDETTTGFLRPYKEGYYFMALLPNKGISMEEYINGLSAQKLQQLIASAKHNVLVDAAIPKFKSEYEIELREVLEQLGMTDAFNPYTANFTGIGTYEELSLFISRVIHKTYIEVDEQGTKAAAATAIGNATGATAMPEKRTVHLDRPFVYAIVDAEQKMPLFLGVLEEVN